MTLLEKAKEAPGNKLQKHDVGDLADLALAYIRKEITGAQAAAALGKKTANVHTILSNALIVGFHAGLLKIERVQR